MTEKTVSRSFRISESAFLALEEEAKKHNISLNTLVNQLFLSYANYDRYFQKLGMLKISKPAFKKILSTAPEKDIIETAREVAQNSARVIILARYGSMSLTGVLDYLRSLADYGNFFEYNETPPSEGKHIITLIHSLGNRFSVYLRAFMTSLFEQIDLVPKLVTTEDSITIEI